MDTGIRQYDEQERYIGKHVNGLTERHPRPSGRHPSTEFCRVAKELGSTALK